MCRLVFAALVAVLTAGCGKPPTASDDAPSFGEQTDSTQSRKEYIFAVLPMHNPEKLFEIYQPLIDRINKHAEGFTMKLETSKTYADFEHKLATGSPHFSLVNPYQAIRAEPHGYRIFGKMADDDGFRGLILVRADSGIQNVSELRGATICFPAPTAVAGCLLPKLFLKQHGLDAELEAKTIYVGTQESSIANVVQGLAKAGGVWVPPWTAFQREKPELAAQLVVKWQTQTLVNNGLLVRDDVPAPVLEAVGKTIFHLQQEEAGRSILERIQLSRFEPATSASFEPMRRFLTTYEETLGRPAGRERRTVIARLWHWLWRRSVRRQLVTGVVLIYVVMMTAFVTGMVRHQRAFLQRKAESQTRFQAALLATSARPGVMSADLVGLEEILHIFQEDRSVLHAMVIDPAGRILAHTDRSRVGLFLRDARSLALLRSAPAERVISSTDEAVECMAPVHRDRQQLGWVRVKRDLSDQIEHLRLLALWGFGFAVVAIGIGAFVTNAIAGAILSPLRLLLRGARRMTQGRLDEPIPVTTENEVGVVTSALNNAMAQLTRQIAERTQAETSLRAQATRIVEEASQLTRAAQNILTTATFFTSNATATAGAVSETSSTMEEIRQTSRLAVEQAREVSQTAEQAAAISRSGQHAAEGAGEGMQRIRDQMAALSEIMQQLDQETQTIGEIITTVEELAETSNLLAVNAAIEAARAGENGRGFSVVAHEVKHLSDQSKQATGRVRSILTEIRKATQSAVLATEHGLRVVDLGAGQSAEAAGSILTLSGSIAQAAQRAAAIAVSTRQQLSGIQQVATTMQEVRRVSAQDVEAAKDLEAAARNLNEMGRRLSELVDRSAAE